MLSPGTCVRCSCSLPAEFVGELCPVCRSAPETSRPTPGTPEQSPPQGEPVTQTYHPSALLNSSSATGPFVDSVERATAAVGIALAARPPTAPPHSLTATGPESQSCERMPFAPPGYDLIRRLGGGGMGDVYLARELVPQRDVAMKFLRSPWNPTALERFIEEIRALARIDHPNIVRFLWEDFNRDQPLFTMEYVPGGNLADRVVADGPLGPDEAARLIASSARAVHAAHAVQVLHRDVKPSNILLAANGDVKVSDFGLAKLVDEDGSLTGDRPLGTPGFMPPEQIARDRRPVGAASDVYGLGATLYYLLTGRAPFVGEHRTEVMAQVERELPGRPRALRPDIPPSLEAVALKCLEKEPAKRYSTAAELADELESYLAGRGTRVLPLTPLRRARRWVAWNRRSIAMAVAAVAVTVGLVIVGMQLRPDPPAPPSPHDVIQGEIASGVARLLDAQGRPRYASWPLGPVELNSTPEDGGTCHFESQDFAALLLVMDPGVDSYHVRAQIRQTKKAGQVIPHNNPNLNKVGLILGFSGQDGPNSTYGHVLTALAYREFDFPVIGQDRMLEVYDLSGVSGAGFARPECRPVRGAFGVRLKPPAGDAPPFRDVEAKVTPEGIWVPDANRNFRLAAAGGINERWGDQEDWLIKRLGGLAGPIGRWSPRKPVGIWVFGSSVSVRNVTIESIK